VHEHVSEMNRMELRSASPLVDKLHRRRLQYQERTIGRVEAEMKALIHRHPLLERDIALLSSIYGVAFLTAARILAELGDLRRFNEARQLTAFAGLSPQLTDSGSSVHKQPHLCKQGNARVRQALYMSAMVAVRGDNDFRRTYLRLIDNGKTAMVALGAIMRRLLVLMRAILLSGKTYDPLWKNRGRDYETITQVT
jgi:transposase